MKLLISCFICLMALPLVSAGDEFTRECSATEIPKDAAFHETHGLGFWLYPADFHSGSYTGCKYMWLEDKTKLFSVYVTRGQPLWFRGRKNPDDPTESICIYQGGVVKERRPSSTSWCPPVQELQPPNNSFKADSQPLRGRERP